MSTINVGKPLWWGIVDGVLFGYARVSTTDQNPAHQLDALTATGVEPANCHLDHTNGAKASRPRRRAAARPVWVGR